MTFEDPAHQAGGRNDGRPSAAYCSKPRSRDLETPFGRRDIDIAIGTLIGIRRCSEDAALAMLVAVARDTHVGLGAASRALVSVVGGEARGSVAQATVDAWTAFLAAETLPRTHERRHVP